MQEFDEKRVLGLKIRIDRTLCVGFGDCIEEAPEVFYLDDEGVAVFVEEGLPTRENVVLACGLCPVDALTLWDESGAQIVP